jgi:hypothetical protein
MTMTAVPQNLLASQNRGTLFLDSGDFDALTEGDLRQLVKTHEQYFFTPCSPDFAWSVADALSKGPNADTASRLELALSQFSAPVVEEIVLRLDQGIFAPTVAELFTYGKEITYWADQTIEPARMELSRRTAWTVAA